MKEQHQQNKKDYIPQYKPGEIIQWYDTIHEYDFVYAMILDVGKGIAPNWYRGQYHYYLLDLKNGQRFYYAAPFIDANATLNVGMEKSQ